MYNIHILSYKWEIQVDTLIIFKIAIAMYVDTRAEVTVLSIRIQKATTLEKPEFIRDSVQKPGTSLCGRLVSIMPA